MPVSVLGFIGGGLLSLSIFPQIKKALETRSTKDIAWGMLCTNITGGILYGLYGILIHSIPVWSTVAVSLMGSTVLSILKVVYEWPVKNAQETCLV
jgi:uncharacterized protein with PQ loop repeat